MPCHRVDGEVAPGKVILHPGCELDLVGMTPVGVEAVVAVRRHLEALAAQHGGDAAELDAGLDDRDARRLKSGGTAPPRAGAADIDIVSRVAEQGVPHPAADDPRFEAGALEGGQDLEGGRCRLDPVQCAPFVALHTFPIHLELPYAYDCAQVYPRSAGPWPGHIGTRGTEPTRSRKDVKSLPFPIGGGRRKGSRERSGGADLKLTHLDLRTVLLDS